MEIAAARNTYEIVYLLDCTGLQSSLLSSRAITLVILLLYRNGISRETCSHSPHAPGKRGKAHLPGRIIRVRSMRRRRVRYRDDTVLFSRRLRNDLAPQESGTEARQCMVAGEHADVMHACIRFELLAFMPPLGF
jgi:hypothetical protein